MKLLARIPCAALILLQIATVSCLPFGAKAKKLQDEDAANANNGEKSVRGAAAKVSKSTDEFSSTASPVVEEFFKHSSSFDNNNNDDDASEVLSASLRDTLRSMANTPDMHEFLQETRRSLHRHPELMYELPFTSDTIAGILDELGIPFTTGWAKNTHPEKFPGAGGFGIVAHIGTGDEDGPCVILRADMDALPILEATNDVEAFRSRISGKMHACGHDGHVTMLLGAAALLKSVETEIRGTVRLVFQPAEEGGAGMKRMVEEGIVDGLQPKAQQAFGMHVWPTLPTGVVASRPGSLMAATDCFEIVVTGQGGHAAMPHLTIDPIVAASSFVSNLQSIVSRTISPLESGVVSVTQFSAGDAFNVIPASATIRGTIRALSLDMLVSLRDKVKNILDATDAMYGTHSTITYMADSYPPTVNDAALFDWSKTVGALVSREGKVRDVVPTMGGEDFSFLAGAIPSMFFFVGQGTGGDERHHIPRTDYGLHHPSFALDEEVLPIGVELHANLALRSLKRLSLLANEEMTTAEEL